MTVQLETNWQIYSQAWSEPNTVKRKGLLGKCLDPEAVYSDPSGKADGIEEISEYMKQFQLLFPDCSFMTVNQKVHNQQSLTDWHLLNLGGEIMMKGTSFGEYDDKGRLLKMSGFF